MAGQAEALADAKREQREQREQREERAERETPDIAAYRELVRSKRGGAHIYAKLLGLRTYDPSKLIQRVEVGLSFSAFKRFQRNLGVTSEELAALVQITPRTLARRRKEGRLSPDESDRLLRASRIFGQALRLFEGDAAAARGWLSTAAPVLGGRTPREACATEVGAREVESLIGRLEHGVFS